MWLHYKMPHAMFILLQTRIRIEAGRMTNKEMRVLEDSAEPVLNNRIFFDVYLVMYCLTFFSIHDCFHRAIFCTHEFHEFCHSVTLYFLKKKGLQMMLWHHNTRINSHQRWKQMRFRICFHLWCEMTITMNVTEWQVSWNSWSASVPELIIHL